MSSLELGIAIIPVLLIRRNNVCTSKEELRGIILGPMQVSECGATWFVEAWPFQKKKT